MEKEKKKGKTIKIIVAIIIAIVVIIGALFLIKAVSQNIKVKQEENKIAQINSEDLQKKIIKEMDKNEKINIETEKIKTTIGTKKMINSDMLDFLVIPFECDNELNDNETDKVVYAFYEGSKTVDNGSSYISLPLFMIDSNDDGSLKRILFLPSFNGGLGVEVTKAIENVLKSEYDINMSQYRRRDAKLMFNVANFHGNELKRLFLTELFGEEVKEWAYEVDQNIYFDAFEPNIHN